MAKAKIIYSQRLAGYLMLRGFSLMSTSADPNGSGRLIFVFRDSNELYDAIGEYLNKK